MSVAAFIRAVPDPTRRAEAEALAGVLQKSTGETPRMWGPSIVRFGSYHYIYESGRQGDAPLAGFAPRKAALVVYVVAGFEGSADLLARLGKHTTGKACLYIKRLADVDLDVLDELVRKSVAAIRAKYPD